MYTLSFKTLRHIYSNINTQNILQSNCERFNCTFMQQFLRLKSFPLKKRSIADVMILTKIIRKLLTIPTYYHIAFLFVAHFINPMNCDIIIYNCIVT